MSNVLPPESKKLLDRRARWRAVFIIGCAGTIGALLGMLALAPTFINIATARAALDAPSTEEASTAREDQAKGRRAQALVDALEPIVLATTTPSMMLAGALDLLPADMSVTAITYQASQRSLVLSGGAGRRESVSVYRDALEGSGLFSRVEIPVAALAGTQDGLFSVTLTAK